MVIDSSALLAMLFAERHATWVADQLNLHDRTLSMSTVNLSEVLILLRDRQPEDYERVEGVVLGSGIRFVPPDVEQALVAAAARGRFPLNLGDCFAYALARQLGEPLLTLDRDFKRTDIELVLPPR